AASAKACIPRVGLYATLRTLEYLRRGGRIGQAATLLGARLHVCPVLYLADEQVHVAGVTRSRRRAKERILDLLASKVGDAPIRASVFHAAVPDEAAEMAEQVQSRFHCLEFFISEFTPVMGAHTGPGTIGVAFCLEEAG
ncbi:MAG: DegV family EDD domain-containing protein, partial [Anaerolineae bacterium]|nr:DegV family EDD domain-containing protein [Anaerolineae bacterium]